MRLGSHAETLVAARLSRSGMRIIARNQRTSEVAGEIDLIALDGRELVWWR
jgi:Holliday junction resolvase-like predicted endonuclease